MHTPFINRHPSNSKEQKRRVDHRSRDSSREKTQSSNVASCERSTGAEFAAHESRSMRSRCVCDWICVCVCDATIYVCACVSCLLVMKNKVESCIYLYTHHPCRHHSLTHISFMGYTRACARVRARAQRACACVCTCVYLPVQFFTNFTHTHLKPESLHLKPQTLTLPLQRSLTYTYMHQGKHRQRARNQILLHPRILERKHKIQEFRCLRRTLNSKP